MKKFILKCMFTIFPFMLSIYAYGFYVNFYLINKLNNSGDLGKLGYFYIDKSHTPPNKLLTENRVDTYNDSLSNNYNILTIGDSFSQQGIVGYQNYLANIIDERILNYPTPSAKGYSPIEIALYLLNNNIYSKLGCKTVILETVERDFIQQIINFRDIKELNSSLKNEIKKNSSNSLNKKVQKDYLIETFKYLKYHLYKSKRPVKEAQLKKEYFSVPQNKTLYFYYADLSKLSIAESEQKAILNNLNYLHRYFKEKGITLYYMIAPDKYDVYQPFLAHNPYRPKTIIDQFEEDAFKQHEWFFNPRKEFRQMISNGIKDVYHIDDTHWTYTASRTVGNIIANKMQSTSHIKQSTNSSQNQQHTQSIINLNKNITP